ARRHPRCPVPGGSVSGVLTASSVVGPGGQLIAAGELAELIAAIRAGVTYVNVHSTAASGGVPAGEIRGQIK
ncbi:MAG: CHRD domain-containing protein, partial [Burkholderiaceae bacterium]